MIYLDPAAVFDAPRVGPVRMSMGFVRECSGNRDFHLRERPERGRNWSADAYFDDLQRRRMPCGAGDEPMSVIYCLRASASCGSAPGDWCWLPRRAARVRSPRSSAATGADSG